MSQRTACSGFWLATFLVACAAPEPSTARHRPASADEDGGDADSATDTDLPADTDAPDDPGGLPENTDTACRDAIDNDLDGYSDCVDFDCADTPACDGREQGDLDCQDGEDNDGDGYIDCVDFGCSAALSCEAAHENTEAECDDGLDNDGDSYFDCVDYGCRSRLACQKQTARLATFNIQVIGEPASPQYDAALAQVRRIDADVLCLEEVEDQETPNLQRLADDAGYENVFQGTVSSSMAGGLTNACLSRFPFVEALSLSSDELAPEASAQEIARDFAFVRVQLPGMVVALFDAHLKSGFDDSDLFRRQVEAVRLAAAVEDQLAAHPGEPVAVMGDFNEEIDGGALGQVFAAPPAGLPGSYELGSDITMPVVYEPFETLTAAGLTPSEPTHEDSTTDFGTRIPSGRRIDYILTTSLVLTGDEVYEVCDDNGIDDPPAGDYLDMAGDPVDCALQGLGSDHRPVFIEIELP